MTEKALEAWAVRALGALDSPKAPDTLLPGLLEHLRSRQRQPWHRRSWHYWPSGLKWAFGLLGAATVGFVAFAWPSSVQIARPAIVEAALLSMRVLAEGGGLYVALPVGLMTLTSALLVLAIAQLMEDGGTQT